MLKNNILTVIIFCGFAFSAIAGADTGKAPDANAQSVTTSAGQVEMPKMPELDPKIWNFIPDVVATVGTTQIKKDELVKILNPQVKMMLMKADKPDSKQLQELANTMATDLVKAKILVSLATEAGFKVTPELEADVYGKFIDNRKKQMPPGSDKDFNFEDIVKQQGFTLEDVKKQMAEIQVIQNWVEAKVMPTVTVTDADVKAFYGANKETYFKNPQGGYMPLDDKLSAQIKQKLQQDGVPYAVTALIDEQMKKMNVSIAKFNNINFEAQAEPQAEKVKVQAEALVKAQAEAKAQYEQGGLYYNGWGAKQDYAEAVKWYRKSAEQGYASAQYMLGFCYYCGDGVKKDYAEAIKWYTKAADQGDASAQKSLGFCYNYGFGVEKDYAEAIKWYTKAADQGNEMGQYFLGDCYRDGKGVKQNYAEAVKWYLKAASQGSYEAKERLSLVKPLYEKEQAELLAARKDQAIRDKFLEGLSNHTFPVAYGNIKFGMSKEEVKEIALKSGYKSITSTSEEGPFEMEPQGDEKINDYTMLNYNDDQRGLTFYFAKGFNVLLKFKIGFPEGINPQDGMEALTKKFQAQYNIKKSFSTSNEPILSGPMVKYEPMLGEGGSIELAYVLARECRELYVRTDNINISIYSTFGDFSFVRRKGFGDDDFKITGVMEKLVEHDKAADPNRYKEIASEMKIALQMAADIGNQAKDKNGNKIMDKPDLYAAISDPVLINRFKVEKKAMEDKAAAEAAQKKNEESKRQINNSMNF